jgi:hypothetical protein
MIGILLFYAGTSILGPMAAGRGTTEQVPELQCYVLDTTVTELDAARFWKTCGGWHDLALKAHKGKVLPS